MRLDYVTYVTFRHNILTKSAPLQGLMLLSCCRCLLVMAPLVADAAPRAERSYTISLRFLYTYSPNLHKGHYYNDPRVYGYSTLDPCCLVRPSMGTDGRNARGAGLALGSELTVCSICPTSLFQDVSPLLRKPVRRTFRAKVASRVQD